MVNSKAAEAEGAELIKVQLVPLLVEKYQTPWVISRAVIATPLVFVVSISATPPVNVEINEPTAPVGTAASSTEEKVRLVSANTGASFVPVMVITTLRLPTPGVPLESVARTT